MKGELNDEKVGEELWDKKAPIIVGFCQSNLSKGLCFVEKPDEIKVNSQESLLVA